MPVTLTAPGVYIEEVPSAVRTITGVATSITAFVGRTRRGPVDEPRLISSFGDFERLYGGLWLDGPMTYAVRDFFLNGGSRALIVRAYGEPEPGSPPPEEDGIARLQLLASPSDVLQLRAADPGEWGNEIRAELTIVTDEQALARYNVQSGELFNLTVQLGDPASRTEQLRNLTLIEGSRRLDRVLEVESQLLRAELDSNSEPIFPETLPTSGTEAQAEGGADSAALSTTDYGVNAELARRGFFALENADLFNLLCLPPDTREGNTPDTVYQAALTYCVRKRAMLIVDPKAEWRAPNTVISGVAGMNLTGVAARNAAIYFPRVIQADPLREDQPDVFVPCGIVAGIMSTTDSRRGVWKAPAGIDAALAGIKSLQVRLNDSEQGELNDLGINCFRTFPVAGPVVWGARTLRGANQLADEYKYIPVRRLALFIEESLFRGTQWVVFEPNDEPLWAQIRLNVGSFMQQLFRQGAFQGKSPREAYLVKCDNETTTQDDINRGVVNILVGFAPLKPAEFVIIQLQQLAGQLAA